MRTTFWAFSLFLSTILSGQNTDTLTQARKNTIFGLPIVYVTPETSWAFGAAGIYSFYLDKKHPQAGTRPSQVQLAFAYTLKDQVLFYMPFDVFTPANRYRFNGEVGIYRYTYFYYGIGNEFSDYPGELFGISFSRIRLNALRRSGKSTYLGIRYWLEKFTINEVENEGLLSGQPPLGVDGGLVSGFGPMYQLDTRDNLFFPRKGSLLEAALLVNSPVFGSDFTFSKFSFNAAKYLEPVPKTVLALNAYLELNYGDAPFNQLALLGGAKRLRGYYEGRFRDNHLLILQGEWRFPIWKRIKGTVFGGVGLVNDKVKNLSAQPIRPAYGAGLRYLALKEQQIHIRLDIAWGEKDNSGFYLTIGEAF